MSEPVIKAVGRRCPKCREYADHAIPWLHCSFCDVDTVELYTRDDLVRVAREAANLAPHHDIEEQAQDLVDRLTKGET